MKKTIFLLLVVGVLIYFPVSATKPISVSPVTEENGHEWIVKWKKEINPQFLRTVDVLHRSKTSSHSETLLVRIKGGEDVERWAEQWSEVKGIEYLHPNHRYTIEENDVRDGMEIYENLYYLRHIRAVEAWDAFQVRVKQNSRLKQHTIVAVVDTGVDLRHPNLTPYLVPGVNLRKPSLPPQDQMGHGTKVAGVIAAVWGGLSNQVPIGNGRIMPIKVMEDGDDGDVYFSAEGIREAIRRGADIIVLAQGSWTYSAVMDDAIKEAEKEGVLVIGAAGNATYDLNGEVIFNRPLFYPAALPSVVGVGAVQANGQHEPSSNQGEGINVVAPGELIYTTDLDGKFSFNSGTSFAAPQVAGVAALIKQLHPEYTPADLRNLICQTAQRKGQTPRWNEKTGFGQLDALAALTTPLSKDISEPNNNRFSSMPVSSGQIIDANLSSQDEDWYHFHFNRPGTLQLKFAKTSGEWLDSRVNITIEETGETAAYVLDEQQEIKVTVPGGRVQLQLASSDRHTEELMYRWNSVFLPEADLYESNDFRWNAARVGVAPGLSIYRGTIHRKGDVDWFRLVIPQEGQLEVTLQTATPRFDPILYLQSREAWKGTRVDRGGEGEREQIQLQVSPGEVFLRVSDYGSNVIEEPYQLFIYYQTNLQDPTEPNLTSRDATPLLLGQELQAQLTGIDDVDWYQFYLDKNQEIELTMFVLDRLEGVQFSLYDHKMNVVETWSGTFMRHQENRWISRLPQGRFWIRVWAEKKTGIGAYRLHLQSHGIK